MRTRCLIIIGRLLLSVCGAAELRTLRFCRKTTPNTRDTMLGQAMLSWFYAWGQTENLVQLVVWLPPEHIKTENVRFGLSPFSLKITTNCGVVIVDRELSFEADPDTPPDAVSSENSPFFAAQIVKKNLGEQITTVFKGDPIGLRCFDEVEHSVSEESTQFESDVEVNVRVPLGTQSQHVRDVVLASNQISFSLEGWGVSLPPPCPLCCHDHPFYSCPRHPCTAPCAPPAWKVPDGWAQAPGPGLCRTTHTPTSSATVLRRRKKRERRGMALRQETSGNRWCVFAHCTQVGRGAQERMQ